MRTVEAEDMRLIPVIDLLDGQAVHAVRGERAHYRPVKSIVCEKSDPAALAMAFRDRLGLNEIYIADLNAIQGSDRTGHPETIAALARIEGMSILLDAGIPDVGKAREWLRLGVHKVIIGSETLREEDALRSFPESIENNRLVFSLDLHGGKILSQYPGLAVMPPMQALQLLQSCGWQEIILLDLRRVGSGEGADFALIAQARAACPDLRLMAGGGICSPRELIELESLGISGVLVATALHRGIITSEHISALGTKN
jgi:phosphoribosylformimino-5-aminoimidazole carboxamide ribotide isomerase